MLIRLLFAVLLFTESRRFTPPCVVGYYNAWPVPQPIYDTCPALEPKHGARGIR